jgi:hypothetical protein
MENIKDLLLSLKEQALNATKNKDEEFYRNYLSDEAIAVVPFGVFNKEAIVQQMSSPNSAFKSVSISETAVKVFNKESGAVTYRATFESSLDKTLFDVFITTVYAKINGDWKGVFYQQTPIK